MLPSTKSALIPLFVQLGVIAANIATLKEVEREASEANPGSDDDTWEQLEELEELLISLGGWFADSEDSHRL